MYLHSTYILYTHIKIFDFGFGSLLLHSSLYRSSDPNYRAKFRGYYIPRQQCEVTDTANVLSIDVKDLVYVDNTGRSMLFHAQWSDEQHEKVTPKISLQNKTEKESIFDVVLAGLNDILDKENSSTKQNVKTDTREETAAAVTDVKMKIQQKKNGIKRKRDEENEGKRSLKKDNIWFNNKAASQDCPYCDYKATTKRNLKRHVESKHQGVCYSCDYCAYKATTKGNLKIHVESKHQGVCYSCDHCDYKATQKRSLKKHKLMHH